MTTAVVAPCHILPGSGFCQKQDSLLKRAIALLWHDGTGANAQVVELLKMPRNTARSPLEGSWKLVGEWHVQCCALKRETCLFQSQLEGKPVEELCCTHCGQARACAVDAAVVFLPCAKHFISKPC